MKYFDTPTQVKFYEPANKSWRGGIAYRDEVICGCCGGILGIEEIEEWAKEDGLKTGIRELSWCPIDEDILGN